MIKKTSTTTNASGVAHTTVNLACVPGSRVLKAKADAVGGPITLNVTAAGLPRTSTALTGAPLSTEPMVGTLLALLALMVGGGLVCAEPWSGAERVPAPTPRARRSGAGSASLIT